MRVLAGAVSLSLIVAGCGSIDTGGGLLYLTPYKLDELPCPELKQRAEGAAKRVAESEGLRDRASRDGGGSLINTVVYSPDYNRAVWEKATYEAEFARRCPAEPPAPAPTRPARRR